jgi:hypothetical protein
MKKLLTLVLLCAVCTAQAHEGFREEYRGGYRGGWVAPALIGGVIGYELSRPRYYEPAPSVVYVQPQPQPVCPYGQNPIYNQVWSTDQYGRGAWINQFAGCR